MKKTQPKAGRKKNPNALTAKADKDFTRDFATPEYQAMMTETMVTARVWVDQLDLKAMREELNRAADEVNAGNMRLPERMAITQAHTLNHLFNQLTIRAFENPGGQWFEPYMRLALRAQAQSARALETLAALKSPAIFTKQLNVANQQVVTQGSAPPSLIAGTPAELPEPGSNSSFGEIQNSPACA